MGLLLLSSEGEAAETVPTVDGPLIRWIPEVVTQTQQWRTDVLKAHDGTEHRIAILPTPRDRFDLQWLLDDEQMREVRGDLLTSPDETFLVPLSHESEPLTAALTGTTLYFDQTYVDWCQVGRAVLVLPFDDQGDDYHQAMITAVGVGSVTISPTAAPLSFPAGSARVYPLAGLYLADGAPLSRWPVNMGAWSLSGATARLLPVLGTGASSIAEYDGLPVLDEVPLNTEQVQEATEAGVQLIDYGGTIASAWGREASDFMRGVRLMLSTRAERQWAKALLDALRGRQCAFLLPTWRPDLPLVSGAVTGGDTIDVESTAFLNGSDAHTRVQFVHANGVVSYHTIVTATDNLDGTHSVELTPVFVADVDDDTSICWLELCRLASDDAVWTHYTARSVLNLSVLVVQQ